MTKYELRMSKFECHGPDLIGQGFCDGTDVTNSQRGDLYLPGLSHSLLPSFALRTSKFVLRHSFVIVSSKFKMLLATTVQAASSLGLSFALKGDSPTRTNSEAACLSRR